MTPAERLKALRQKAGLSQKAIAEYIGCGVRTWQHWEDGDRTPADWTVKLIEYYILNELKVK